MISSREVSFVPDAVQAFFARQVQFISTPDASAPQDNSGQARNSENRKRDFVWEFLWLEPC
jgi:hypothetical protein